MNMTSRAQGELPIEAASKSLSPDATVHSITYRTACSSSMVALHEACQALYTGECSSAIVGGSNLIMAPTMTTSISENMVLSPSGFCRTFDASADGYGRGEAINAVYIKPLADAVRQGDPIRAVIRSTATNCDGRTPTITTPGSEAQERLIRRAYLKAGIGDPSQTAFFECHGTGTIAGDMAETSVIANMFHEDGVYIGAVCLPISTYIISISIWFADRIQGETKRGTLRGCVGFDQHRQSSTGSGKQNYPA